MLQNTLTESELFGNWTLVLEKRFDLFFPSEFGKSFSDDDSAQKTLRTRTYQVQPRGVRHLRGAREGYFTNNWANVLLEERFSAAQYYFFVAVSSPSSILPISGFDMKFLHTKPVR